MNVSKERSFISGRDISRRIAEDKAVIAMDAKDVANYRTLEKVGIAFSQDYLKSLSQAYAMDDATNTVFPGSIPTPVQNLQAWLPGFVRAAYAPRKIDELVGIATVGNWHDQEVVQGILENTGEATTYGDTTNIPLVSYNKAYAQRTVVRFESGLLVGKLETARAAAERLNAAAEKRISAEQGLEMRRNQVGFLGFNDGLGRTYGLLNDPALPAYETVAQGASNDTKWSTKTFLEITADIRNAFAQLTIRSGGVVEAETSHTVLAVPTGIDTFLSVTSDFGNSVRQWLNETYPKCRVVSVPQFADANGGQNVFYLYAEEVNDGATDDSRVFLQAVPAKFIALGIQNTPKAIIEDFSNATAGVMCKRPYAVYRGTGI